MTENNETDLNDDLEAIRAQARSLAKEYGLSNRQSLDLELLDLAEQEAEAKNLQQKNQKAKQAARVGGLAVAKKSNARDKRGKLGDDFWKKPQSEDKVEW